MGVKKLHLQLAAKRRWQTMLDADTDRDATRSPLQVNTHQRKWSAQYESSKFRVLP